MQAPEAGSGSYAVQPLPTVEMHLAEAGDIWLSRARISGSQRPWNATPTIFAISCDSLAISHLRSFTSATSNITKRVARTPKLELAEVVFTITRNTTANRTPSQRTRLPAGAEIRKAESMNQ